MFIWPFNKTHSPENVSGWGCGAGKPEPAGVDLYKTERIIKLHTFKIKVKSLSYTSQMYRIAL